MFPLFVQIILMVIPSVCKGQRGNTCKVVPQDKYIEMGSDTKIECYSMCYPGKVFWMLDNRKMDQSLSRSISSSHSVLQLRNFSELNATVLCHSAASGEILGGTTIRTYTKPASISCILHYTDQEATGAPELLTCSWEHQVNPSKVVNYTVLGASWCHPLQTGICSAPVKTCTTNYKKISDKIPIIQSFNVTVRAKSADYEVYSESQEFIAYQIWKMVRPKVKVTPRSGSLLLEWTQMDLSEGGDCHCQVKHNKLVNSTTLSCEEKGEMMFDELDSCSIYTFAVRCAVDGAPWSDWSLEEEILTKLNRIDVKLRFWRKVSEPAENGLRTVHAMWTGIPSSCQETFTYMIQLISINKNNHRANHTKTICGNSTCDVQVNQDANEIILTVLRNGELLLEESVSVPAVTESFPEVTGIQTATLMYQSMLVSWTAPCQPVSGYMIDYTHDGNQFNWMETKNTNATLTGLLDGKPYNITVTPLFTGKTGHGTQVIHVCSSVGVPGNVSITNVETYDTSAVVSWDVRMQGECSAAVVRFTVFYMKQRGPQLNVTVDGSRKHTSLKDLSPDTQYHVYVEAAALSGSTQSREWLFLTKTFDPRIFTAVLVIASFLVFVLAVCFVVQWIKFKEKPVPNPRDSSVGKWSLAGHQQGSCPIQPFSVPCESRCDRVYTEDPERTSFPPPPAGCKRNPASDLTAPIPIIPDVAPAAGARKENPEDTDEMLNPPSPNPEETTALLLLESNQLSPYRSQTSVDSPAQRNGRQSKRAALKQQEKTQATVYVTLDMFDQGKRQLREMEAKPKTFRETGSADA